MCRSWCRVPAAAPRIDTRKRAFVAQDEVWTSQALAYCAPTTQTKATEGTSLELDRSTSCVDETIVAEAGVPAHHLAWAEE